MSAIDDLLNVIFDKKKSALSREFEGWVRDSRRFKDFATLHQTKIRTKLRNANGDEGLKDVRAELETAALLLKEKRFTLEYETYNASKQRGPDFTVTYKTHTPFNVEVRRIRSVELENDETTAHVEKLVTILIDKVGQMPPSIINILWFIDEREVSEEDLNTAMVLLRQLAERKVEDFFTKWGYHSAASFLKQYRQLSAIGLRHADENVLWLNSMAQHKAPPDLVRTLQRLGID